MKISRDNPDFDNYDIIITVDKHLFGFRSGWRDFKLKNVVEADDDSGFLVQHLTDDNGNLIYTNGHDEISIDNTVKFLMCNPQLRQGFLAAGFRPKLTSRYEKTLRMARRVGVLEKRSEVKETSDFSDERVQFDGI